MNDPVRDPWPSVADPDDRDCCPHCEALDAEQHQIWCPLFLPLCRCGTPARRFLKGQPVCVRCQQQIAAQAACCTGNDPACPTHGVAASNARQNGFCDTWDEQRGER